MIGKMDKLVEDLASKEKQLKKELETEETDKKKQELLQIDEIVAAIQKIQKVPDETRIEQIKNVLGKIDDDSDGSVKVEDVLKVRNWDQPNLNTCNNYIVLSRSYSSWVKNMST